MAIQNGVNAESDVALRARIPGYFASLRSATPAAIEYAATSVQQGVKLQLANNYPQAGFYTLYVDDGTGAAPSSFRSATFAAVAAVTGEGVQPTVLAPTIVSVAIIASLQIATGAIRPNVVANVNAALAAFVAALPIGGTLPYLQLPVIIYAADSNVTVA